MQIVSIIVNAKKMHRIYIQPKLCINGQFY